MKIILTNSSYLLKNSIKIMVVFLLFISCSNDSQDTDNQNGDDNNTNNLTIPERIPSFGPNGTHWPNVISTPFMYDESIPNQIIVNNDWNAITEAIISVTDEMANAGTLILIQPGELIGDGVGAGAQSALKDLGSLSWNKRITIAPLQGYGTVTVTGGAKYVRLYNIAITGIIYDSLKLQGCSHSAIAWSKVTGWSAYYGVEGVVTENIEIIELVRPDSKVEDNDTADAFTAGGALTNITFTGCYYAPSFYAVPVTGASPHTDTLQFAEVNGGGQPSNITLKDCALFSSNNCSLQTGGMNGLILNHSYIVSGDVSLSRYPHLPGGATVATTNAINGAGQNFESHDSVILGGIALNEGTSPRPWKEVTNTLVNAKRSGTNEPLTGAWTVDENLDETNSGMPPYPTDEYLEGIWAK